MKAWIRTTDTGLKSMKVEFTVNGSVQSVLCILNKSHIYRERYDKSFESQRYLQKVNDSIWLNYSKVKKYSIVSARDVIIIVNFLMTEDGVIYIIAYSDEREDLVPVQPDIVRAGLPIGGWKIQETQPGRVKLTYFVEVDTRGNIPTFVMTPALKDQA